MLDGGGRPDSVQHVHVDSGIKQNNTKSNGTENLEIVKLQLKYKKVSKRLKLIEKSLNEIVDAIHTNHPHEVRMALQKLGHSDEKKWCTEYESPITVSLAAAITGVTEKSIYVWVDNGLINHVTKVHVQSPADPEPEYYPEMVYVSDVFAYAAQCGYRRNTRHKNED